VTGHASLTALAALLLAPAPVPTAPATPSAPIPRETVENVRIRSEPGVILAAALHLPKGKGPWPVVIVQAGTGPQKRGAYITLQQRLTAAGIATIDFDKRGTGESTGTFTDTLQDMEADIAATIRWLRARDDIDGRRIVLLGHSQGAVAASIVAERDGGLAAIVFLAGPVGARGTVLLAPMRERLILTGRSPETADKVVAATRDLMEARSRTAPVAEITQRRSDLVAAFAAAGFAPNEAEGATRVFDTAQLLSMYEASPGPALAHLRIPVLAVFAGRDEGNDGGANSIVAASAALADNPEALVVGVPGAGHVFTYRAADAPPYTNPPGGRWLFPETLIADWLIGRLTVRSASGG